MDGGNQTIEQTTRAIARAIFLRHAMTVLAAGFFLWGTTTLVCRIGFRLEGAWLAAVGLVILPFLPAAALLARRQSPPATAVRALLDARHAGGGLLVAAEEVPLRQWSGRLPPMNPMSVRVRTAKPLALVLLGAVYVAAAFLAPAHLLDAAIDRRLDSSIQADRLEQQITVLEKEKILDAREAQNWRERLEQTTAESSGHSPAKTLEALDRLSHELNQKAEEAAANDAKAIRQSAAMETGAEALQKDAALTPEELSAAMAELGKRVEKMAAERKMVQKLPEELAKAMAAGKLTKEQLKALSKAMGANKGDLLKQMEALQKSGLLDAEALKKAAEMAEGNAMGEQAAQELASMLKDAGNGASMNDRMEEFLAACENPGAGAPTRGGGTASLNLSNKSNLDGTKFDPEQLPPSQARSLKDSQLVGTSAAAPELNQDGSSSGGALAGAAAGGGSASRHVVLPRHQGVVKRYFEHEGKSP